MFDIMLGQDAMSMFDIMLGQDAMSWNTWTIGHMQNELANSEIYGILNTIFWLNLTISFLESLSPICMQDDWVREDSV
jgi:hypothetical protein